MEILVLELIGGMFKAVYEFVTGVLENKEDSKWMKSAKIALIVAVGAPLIGWFGMVGIYDPLVYYSSRW